MCLEHGKLIWTRSAYFHMGPRHVESRIEGRRHVSTRSHAAPSNKILLASTGASTHVAGVGGCFLVSLGSGLLIILKSPGAGAPDPTSQATSGSSCVVTARTTGSRIRAFRASTPSPRQAKQVSAPPAPRNRLYRVACQPVNQEHFNHGEVRLPHSAQTC